MENHYYTVALRNVKGIGNKLAQKLLSVFDSPADIFSLDEKDIAEIDGISPAAASAIASFSEWDAVEKTVLHCERSGFTIITVLDENYPANLFEIYEKPTVLYCFGEITAGDENAVAVVGARFCNDYGRKVSGKLSYELAESGVTVVSGMARGIDSVAHSAALKAGGRTVAVLGSGLDRIYPPENARLYRKISENGAVISEFPLGTSPDAKNFPRRNRLISGISKGVIIVQASRKSGSLITSNFALEQNREVFAVPGNIGNRLAEGTNDLIKKGAKLIQSTRDVIEELNLYTEKKYGSSQPVHQLPESLSENERAVCRLLEKIDLNLEEIIEETDIEYSELCSILLELELKGILNQLPGKKYQLAR